LIFSDIANIYQEPTYMNENPVDHQIIQAIKSGDRDGIKQLYQLYFNMIATLILKNNGTRLDAEDIFQEVLVTAITKVRLADFQLTSRLSSYLYSIAKNMWLYRLRKEKKIGFVDTENQENIPDDNSPEGSDSFEEKHLLIAKVFDQISEECRKILNEYYFEKKALKDIGTQMQYTEGSIRVKKLRCMESLKKKVEAHPDYIKINEL